MYTRGITYRDKKNSSCCMRNKNHRKSSRISDCFLHQFPNLTNTIFIEIKHRNNKTGWYVVDLFTGSEDTKPNTLLYCLRWTFNRTTNETLNRYFILCEYPCVVHIVPTIKLNVLLQSIKNGNFMCVIKYASGNSMDSVSNELNKTINLNILFYKREFLWNLMLKSK